LGFSPLPPADDFERYPDLAAGQEAFPQSATDDFQVTRSTRSISGPACVDVIVKWDQNPGGIVLACGLELNINPAAWFRCTWADNGLVDHDFGVVTEGTLVSRRLVIENSGSGSLTVMGINEGYQDLAITSAIFPFEVPPGQTRAVNVEIDTTGLNQSVIRDLAVQTANGRFYNGLGIASSQLVRLTGTVTDQILSVYGRKQSIDLTASQGAPISNTDRIVGMDAGDTDNDGRHEIVVLADDTPNSPGINVPRLFIFEAEPSGTFVLKWDSGTMFSGMEVFSRARNVVVSDVTGDGREDIVFAINRNANGTGTYGTLFLLQSTGDDTWGFTWSGFDNLGWIADLAVGDSDNDGQQEILGVFDTGNTAAVHVFENNGGASFVQSFSIPQIIDPSGDVYTALGALTVADSDNDGRNEILFTSGNRETMESADNDADQLFIYESAGNNSYAKKYSGLSYQKERLGPWDHALLAIADIDGDSRQEIVLADGDDYGLFVWQINGNDSWVSDISPTNYEYKVASYTGAPFVLQIGDTDGDGRKNILLGFEFGSPDLVVIESFVTNSYIEEWRTPNMFLDEVNSIAVGSVDGSGQPQFVVADREGPVSLFEPIRFIPFLSSHLQPGGALEISHTGDPGWPYIIQESADLVTWTNVKTNIAPATGLVSLVTAATNQPAQFYRVQLAP
jgi:hypothetical protein